MLRPFGQYVFEGNIMKSLKTYCPSVRFVHLGW